jgi:hypothetical protein
MAASRRRLAGSAGLGLALSLLLSVACGPGLGGGGGVTVSDADGVFIGTVISVDTHWVEVYHSPTNAIMRLNMTTGNVAGPGRTLNDFLQPFVYTDYFFTENGCGEDLWRAATSDEAYSAPPIGEIVSLGADAHGWEEGESVWVSGGTAEDDVVPAEYVITDGEGNLLCGEGNVNVGEVGLCNAVQAAFDDEARVLCEDNISNYDVWFTDSTCETANEDGYDNTAFYECLIEKFSNPNVDHTCETDSEGNPTAIRQFEDTSQSSDPPGCRELYQATPDDSGGAGGPGGSYPVFQLGTEICAYQATQTEDVPTSFAAPLQLQGL